ncbi:MAG: A/G-specific adenine glycosylase [Patescibacteria group bacterium]|nr:A/G-specific adenine glycosylase [Patescibacteria group bacterium]
MRDDKIKEFKKIIRDFYGKNKRILPWRKTRDPYQILVSEIMLQQTQVSRVLLKYPEFIKAFPTLKTLAKAPFSDVLRAWQGLGYNRRARALKRASEAIWELYKGKIPKDIDQLLGLPGIGPSTAGGILAFAYGIPYPFIETNIRRIFIHHFFPRKNNVHDREILRLVEKTMDAQNPREWYYALFDYGTHLGKQVKNPNRRSKHYTKQKAFEGSHRQIRGMVLRRILEKGSINKQQLKTVVKIPEMQLKRAVEELLKEGFIKERRGRYQTI